MSNATSTKECGQEGMQDDNETSIYLLNISNRESEWHTGMIINIG